MAKRKPKTTTEFFECECTTWEELNALVADLPDAAWVQPGAAGDWSPKDVWAHLAAWMKETRRVMPLLLRGERVSARIQEFNRAQHERDCNLPLGTVRRRVERERQSLLTFLKKMSEEELLRDRRIYTWASYATYNHYAEHVEGLKRFCRLHLPFIHRRILFRQ